MKNDYKMMCEMIETGKEQLATLDQAIDMLLSFKFEITDCKIMREKISKLRVDEIDEFTLEELLALFVDDKNKTDILKLERDKETKDMDDLEYARHSVKFIKSELDSFEDAKNDYILLVKDKDRAAAEYVEYLNSPEYQAERKAKIDKLREECETTEDKNKKYLLKKRLNAIDSLDTMSFLNDGFNKNQERERQSVIDAFFGTGKADYIFKRYEQRCTKLKIDANRFKCILNIEEGFLPESYHIYNNLFLFFSIRYIAYTDTSDKDRIAYAISLVANLTKLKYNQFTNEDDKQFFIKCIMNVLDNFSDLAEKFEAENSTHPKHPIRMEHDEKLRIAYEQYQKEEAEKKRLEAERMEESTEEAEEDVENEPLEAEEVQEDTNECVLPETCDTDDDEIHGSVPSDYEDTYLDYDVSGNFEEEQFDYIEE